MYMYGTNMHHLGTNMYLVMYLIETFRGKKVQKLENILTGDSFCTFFSESVG